MRNGEATLAHLLAPIQDALDDPATIEIVTQRAREVAIERGGKWEWREVPNYDFRRLDAIGILASSLLSKRFDGAHPICETTLLGGQRFTVCRPPVTWPDTIVFSCRNPSKEIHTTEDDDFSDLVSAAETTLDRKNPVDIELGELHKRKQWPAFFKLAVKNHKFIACCGAVRSGKTHTLRRLMHDIDPSERLVTIEDTDEFGPLSHLRNRVALFFGSPGITALDLVRLSLRLRPDRMALQELRGAEALALLRMIAAGFTGGFTSWHAEERDPFTPLALMVKSHDDGRNIPDDKLDLIIRNLIDIVVYCHHDTATKKFSIPSIYYRGAVQ